MDQADKTTQDAVGTDNAQATGADKTTDQAAGADKTAAAAADKKKFKFDDEQQAFIDALYDNAFGKGMSKAKEEIEKQFKGQLEASTSEISTLKKQLEALTAEKADSKKAGGSKAEQEQLQAQIDEIKTALKAANDERETLKQERNTLASELTSMREASKQARVKDEFMTAATGIKFFNMNQVYALVRDSLKLEGDDVVVLNPKTGRPFMDYASGTDTPLSLASYLRQFAKDNPHMVQASDADGGTGSGESRRVDTKEKTQGGLANVKSMSLDDFEALKTRIKSGAYKG